LCQFQADILGVQVVRPKVVEITSLGAAYLAGLAVGYWQNARDIEKCWNLDKTFKNSMTQKQRSRLYDGWRNAITRVM